MIVIVAVTVTARAILVAESVAEHVWLGERICEEWHCEIGYGNRLAKRRGIGLVPAVEVEEVDSAKRMPTDAAPFLPAPETQCGTRFLIKSAQPRQRSLAFDRPNCAEEGRISKYQA
jgi:hypothetical protein